MKKLKALLNGRVVSELHLEENHSYIIGRDKSADIVLDPIEGISRRHIKVYFKENSWHLKVISKFGNVLFEGEIIDELLLDVSLSFNIPPYEFNFETQAPIEASSLPSSIEMPAPLEIEGTRNNLPSVIKQKPQFNKGESFSDDITSSGEFENIIGVIKWRDGNGKKKGYKFSQGTIVIGRGENCEVCIQNNLLSRRHFEISKIKNQFYIVDLGSANGTKLNNKSVSKNQPMPIDSGDKISVSGFRFSFQIKDEHFEKKLNMSPMAQPVPLGLMPVPPAEAGARVVKIDENNQRVHFSKFQQNSSKMKYIIGGVLTVLVLFLLLEPSTDNQKGEVEQTSSSNIITFEKLTPEEKSIVMDSFKLGKNHFNQKKYANCVKEFEKLHKIIPFYMNSKEIAGLCDQTLALEKENNEIERKRKEKVLMEQRILAIVEDCKQQNLTNSTEANECIGPAITMYPDHPAILDYQNNILIHEQKNRDEASKRAYRQQQISKGESLYFNAKSSFEKQNFRQAIDRFEAYISSSYPDPKGYRGLASKDLSVAKKKLAEKVRLNFDECKKLYNDRRFKESILSCLEALDEDPNNQEVDAYKKMVTSELRKEMKTIYQDAILEESLGNIDAAKEKWKKIMELDLESDEFYQKSKSKLKKYGIGI
jgi:pSer/pThr/pTyr-binding forkhead associated (FHA) protein